MAEALSEMEDAEGMETLLRLLAGLGAAGPSHA